MAGFFSNIRNQPTHIRDAYMWVFLTLVAITILFIWLVFNKDAVLDGINPNPSRQAHIASRRNAEHANAFAFIGSTWDDVSRVVSRVFDASLAPNITQYKQRTQVIKPGYMPLERSTQGSTR